MARTTDYRTPTGTKSNYSIVLDDTVGLTLDSGSPVRGSFGPGEQGLQQIAREVPQRYSDWSNGMGYAYRTQENTYAFAINGHCRTPRKYMPGGRLTEISLDDLGMTETELSGEIRCAVEYGNDVIVGAGSLLLRLPNGEAPIVYEYDLGPGSQVDSAIVYNSFPLFSTDPTYDNWQYLTGHNGTSWVTAHRTGDPPSNAENPVNYANAVYLQKMAIVFQEVDGTGGWRLVGNDSTYSIAQIQSQNFDDIIGNTTVYGNINSIGTDSNPVGDGTYRIQNIIATNRIFYVVKVDGVYGIESAGVYCPNYTPNWRKSTSLLNGLCGEFFDGHLFVGTYEGLERVDVANRQRMDVPIKVSPSYYLSNETPIFGVPVASEIDSGWLVVALWNGLDTHLCYTRPREDTLATVPNPMIWHGSECTLEGQRVTMLFKTNISGQPQMLIGAYDGTRMRLYTLSLPMEGDPFTDFLHGGNHKFTQRSKLYLPFDDWKDGTTRKVIRRFDIQTDGLSIPEFDPITGDLLTETNTGEIKFYANADSGSRVFFEDVEPSAPNSEWHYQGSAAESPKTTMIPTGATTIGTEISILLDGTLTDLAANPGVDEPIYYPFSVRSIKVRAEVLIEQMEEREYTVILGHLNSTKSGGRDFNSAITKFSQLYALQDRGPISMVDELGMKNLVKVEPGMVYELIPEREGQPPTYIAKFSVTLLGRQFIYDAGHNFDSIYSWGA